MSPRPLLALVLVLSPALASAALPPSPLAGTSAMLCRELSAPAVAGCEAWSATYDGTGSDFDSASGVVIVPGSKIAIAAGLSDGVDLAGDLFARGIDSSAGREVWVTRFNGATGDSDRYGGLVADPRGERVYLTGSTRTPAGGYRDFVTMALDAHTGAILWTTIFDGPAHAWDFANDLAISADGSRLFVTGRSDRGFPMRADYLTIAYETATGAPVWSATYNGPGSGTDEAFAVAVSADGATVAVTGMSYGSDDRWGGTGFDVATVAYDAATGAERWAARHHRTRMAWETGEAIALTPDGARVIVTADSHDSLVGGADFVTLAYEASSGALQWRDDFDGEIHANDRPRALALSSDGAVAFVAGETTAMHDGINMENDYAVVAYRTATGERRWVATYHSPSGGDDSAFAVALAPDGSRVYATGRSHGGASNYDIVTVAFDATVGTRAWNARHDGPAGEWDGAGGIAVSPDGASVLVAGGVGTGNLEADAIVVGIHAQTAALLPSLGA